MILQPIVKPISLTILPTYQCTAACKECCFECSPHVNHSRIPTDRILKHIDDAVDQLPSIELIVFSGGECFMLGQDLDMLIARATSHGKLTRCVTNGYWATSLEAARKRMESAREAGLKEINFSTGDDHQEWVPFDRIVNGVIAAAELGITTLVVIEGHAHYKFSLESALEHPRLKEWMASSPHSSNLTVFRNVWMGFHDKEYELDQQWTVGKYKGCSNCLNNIVITPHEMLASCCGLTMEHIPEMKVGSLRTSSFAELHQQQARDLLKLWIWLDGTHAILDWCKKKDPSLDLSRVGNHVCEACTAIYQNDHVKQIIREHLAEIQKMVVTRVAMKQVSDSLEKNAPLLNTTTR